MMLKSADSGSALTKVMPVARGESSSNNCGAPFPPHADSAAAAARSNVSVDRMRLLVAALQENLGAVRERLGAGDLEAEGVRHPVIYVEQHGDVNRVLDRDV